MKRFATRYLKAALLLLFTMGIYYLTVVPAIEPPPREATERPEYIGGFAKDQWWGQLFPEGSWQRDNPTIVRNNQGVLLASSWEQIGEKSWKLQPLSIILPQSHTPADSADNLPNHLTPEYWVISAEAGAIIHFEQPLDLRSGIVPSIERGQLEGQIDITRKDLDRTNESLWTLSTSDLSIDRRRISTQQEVVIRWNDSVVRGHDLRIMLRGDVLGGEDHGVESPWGPLDELELYHLDEFNVGLPAGGLWGGFNSESLAIKSDISQLPARLTASCGGRMTFDFNDSIATLTNGVHLRHLLGTLTPDEFLCHKLSIQIDPPNSDATVNADLAAQNASNKRSTQVGGMRVRKLIALGIDSLQNFVGEKSVEVNAPTLGATARAKQLEIDFDRQRIELAGKLDRIDATQSLAWLQYQGFEFSCPKLEFQAAPTGPDGQPEHLGWMFAQGPGELNASAASQLGESHVRWQESLKMAPAQTPGEQWLELAGNTFVESKLHGFLTTDILQMWVKKTANVIDPSSGNREEKYVPDRLLATGPTTVSTTDFKVDVEKLKLGFILVPPQLNSPTSQENKGLMLSDSAGNPMYQFVRPPVSSPATPEQQLPPGQAFPTTQTFPTTQAFPMQRGPTQGRVASDNPSQSNSNPSASNSPISIVGKSLDAKIISAGDQTWADSLTISGPVTIQELQPQRDAIPWSIAGASLNLATNPTGQVDLQLDGQPARMQFGEGHLEGPSIRFDQRNNLIWMDKPGEFTIPASALNKSTDLGTNQWVKPPHCEWTGRLMFDGSVAKIEGDIKLDGTMRQPDQLWWIMGFCDQLDINLQNPIDFRNAGGTNARTSDSPDSAMSVSSVVLRKQVDIRLAQTDLRGNRKSLQRMLVPVLTFDLPQQKLTGGGAGWIHSKFLSDKQPGALASTQSNSPGLQGANLSFRDSLVYFLEQNEVVFEGKVELASGPLKDWEDTIDLVGMQRLGTGQMLLNSDQLKVYDTSGLSSVGGFTSSATSSGAWEFQATGNVVFEGKTTSGNFLGNGYQVTYTQIKDRLLLRGDGRSPAYIQRTPLDPSIESTFKASVNSAAINVRTMGIEDLKLSQFQIDLPSENGSAVPDRNAPIQPPNYDNSLNPRAGVSRFFDSKKK